MNLTEEYKLLKTYRHKLSVRQYQSLKGQIKAGKIDEYRKALFNIQLKRIDNMRGEIDGRTNIRKCK